MLTIAEIERRFGVGPYWVHKWAKQRRLHVVPDGKRFKYPDWEIRDLLSADGDLSWGYSTLTAAA
jgi:hypothetical protein